MDTIPLALQIINPWLCALNSEGVPKPRKCIFAHPGSPVSKIGVKMYSWLDGTFIEKYQHKRFKHFVIQDKYISTYSTFEFRSLSVLK